MSVLISLKRSSFPTQAVLYGEENQMGLNLLKAEQLSDFIMDEKVELTETVS